MGAVVGFFSNVFSRSSKASSSGTTGPQSRHVTVARVTGGEGFVVIDVETTGLSPNADRILELAVVRTDERGHVMEEWSSRFNPQGPVGATKIHGITAADVRHAPLFTDRIDEIVDRLQGAAVVAHNARFDTAFLRGEFARAGWQMPWLPTLCTLEASRHYLSDLDRRRLPDCCHAAGIRLTHAHSALGDARATADLLAYYLDPNTHPGPRHEHLTLPHEGAVIVWPHGPSAEPVAQPAQRTRATNPYRAPVKASPR